MVITALFVMRGMMIACTMVDRFAGRLVVVMVVLMMVIRRAPIEGNHNNARYDGEKRGPRKGSRFPMKGFGLRFGRLLL